MENLPYSKRLSQAAIAGFKKSWRGYRILVALSGLASLLIMQMQKGHHSLISLGEAVVGCAVGLALSVIGTYLYSRKKAAEGIDGQWCEENAHFREALSAAIKKAAQLTDEINALRKPKIEPKQKWIFEKLKPLMVAYDDEYRVMLKQLHVAEEMTHSSNRHLFPLPEGVSHRRALQILHDLYKDHLACMTESQTDYGWRITWKISPHAKPIMDSLLLKD